MAEARCARPARLVVHRLRKLYAGPRIGPDATQKWLNVIIQVEEWHSSARLDWRQLSELLESLRSQHFPERVGGVDRARHWRRTRYSCFSPSYSGSGPASTRAPSTSIPADRIVVLAPRSTCVVLETFDNSVGLRVEYPRVRRAARSTSRLIIRGRRESTEWSFLLKTAGCSCSGGSTS